MAGKSWLKVELIYDGSRVVELLEFCHGRTLKPPQMQIIRHGGEGENGEIKPRPSVRSFLLAYGAAHPTFTVSDAAKGAVAQLGVTNQGVSSMIYVMKEEGLVKRIGPGTYRLMKAGRASLKSGPAYRRAPDGTTAADKILAVVRAKQNSSGDGVPYAEIKSAIGDKKNISPAITKLLQWKKLKRVAPAQYRAIEE